FCSPVDCSNFFGAPCFLKISANEASTASGFSLNNSYCSSTYPMFGPKKLFHNLLLSVEYFTSNLPHFIIYYYNYLFFTSHSIIRQYEFMSNYYVLYLIMSILKL